MKNVSIAAPPRRESRFRLPAATIKTRAGRACCQRISASFMPEILASQARAATLFVESPKRLTVPPRKATLGRLGDDAKGQADGDKKNDPNATPPDTGKNGFLTDALNNVLGSPTARAIGDAIEAVASKAVTGALNNKASGKGSGIKGAQTGAAGALTGAISGMFGEDKPDSGKDGGGTGQSGDGSGH
jgi:hypothetical protein